MSAVDAPKMDDEVRETLLAGLLVIKQELADLREDIREDEEAA